MMALNTPGNKFSSPQFWGCVAQPGHDQVKRRHDVKSTRSKTSEGESISRRGWPENPICIDPEGVSVAGIHLLGIQIRSATGAKAGEVSPWSRLSIRLHAMAVERLYF
jgi:hypothetical protein